MSENEKRLRGVAKTQCGGCGKYFNSLTMFDAHRIGPSTDRRCMTTDEMLAAGMAVESCQIRAYHDGSPHQEVHDVWYDIVGREKMRERFGRMPSQGYGTLPEAG